MSHRRRVEAVTALQRCGQKVVGRIHTTTVLPGGERADGGEPLADLVAICNAVRARKV